MVLEAGADDVLEYEDAFIIYTKPGSLHIVCEKLKESGLIIENSELYFKPLTTIQIDNPADIIRIEKLIDLIEERDDILKVFSNYALL